MKLKITPESIQTLLKVAFFLCTIAIIIQLFPKQEAFEYEFNIGKPWTYELVTAPFDYPIYKDDELYQKEQKDIMRTFAPYYRRNDKIAQKAMKDFIDRTTLSETNSQTIPLLYKKHISVLLNYVYLKGIISSEELDTIKANGQTKINIIDYNNISRTSSINELFTVKTAYAYIIINSPEWANNDYLRSLNLNRHLTENLVYNKVFSDRGEREMLKLVSPKSGMVQAGERIIDRGEIITKKSHGLLGSLKIEINKQKSSDHQYNLMFMGKLIIVFTLMMLLFLYFYLFRKHIFESKKDLLFLLLMILLMVSLAVISLKISILSIYLVPFALLPIIVRTFFDTRTASFIHTITILQISLIVPDSFEFIMLQLVVGMAVVSSLKDLTQRSQLFRAAILVFVGYSIMYVGNCLLIEGDANKIVMDNFKYFGINAFLLFFAYGLIYIFEKIFGFLSNVTLVELSNVNNPLMLKLSEIAPGTFHHSLQLANLVTEAGKKINANILLLRVGALYHDIGKLKNPTFFTENQLSNVNPLEDLDYETAAQHIIDHVQEGVKTAEKNGLPDRVIDFIRTHHGKSRTRYFYNSFINKYPNALVNEQAFMYEGPSPKTKEQALMMMADAVEASSRSLHEYSDVTINMLVDTIIDKQIADGLLRDAKITFADVEVVKEVLKEKLKTIYHTRVSYPELEKDKKHNEEDGVEFKDI